MVMDGIYVKNFVQNIQNIQDRQELYEYLDLLFLSLSSSRSIPIRHLNRMLHELEELDELYLKLTVLDIEVKEVDKELLKSLKNSETICSICIQDFKLKDNIGITECDHNYHKECIDEWYLTNDTCPNCRRKLPYTCK